MDQAYEGQVRVGVAAADDVGVRLGDAIESGTVRAVFQRIVEVPVGRTVKVEALARWEDPVLGSVLPAVFVPVAERLDLIGALDRAMLKHACRALSGWRAAQYPDLGVAVNMSPLTLASADIGPEILEVIAAAGLPVSSVWIEATETAMVGAGALATIRMLAAAGVRISLDDFGTGFSSLSHLMELPVDAVKIDRSIVAHAATDPTASAIVRSLVGIGRELGISVIAEGVESDADERAVRRLGVTLLQGFRFGKPVPAATALDPTAIRAIGRSACAVPAALPLDEEERLAALHALQVLDTTPEAAFDTLTAIAAEMLGTPIALVSLIDGSRQWFKSRVGLDAIETPREEAFCAHAILGRDVFVVEDASQDARFAGNPLVTGHPDIRFYAGAPLVTSSGHALGTLCVIDRRARRLDDAQLRLLSALAEQVIAHLELRSVTAGLAEALDANRSARVALAHEASHDPLTGLANRKLFFEELDTRLQEGDTGVLYVDLNKFKELNDRYGHGAGDELLIAVGSSLRRAVRPGDLVARLGGDEFAVILRVADDAQLAAAATRVQSLIRQPLMLGGGVVVVVEAAVGGSSARPGDDVNSLVARADAAMYHHKYAHR